MRAIWFRGKLKNDSDPLKKGDWVEGRYVGVPDRISAISHINGYSEVFPETVGKYTGLTDINGVKIFEGDIVEFSPAPRLHRATGEVARIPPEGGAWVVVFRRRRVACRLVCPLCKDIKPEVIGNIHDNPEILKKE